MNKTIKHLVGATCLLPAALLMSACIDNSVDYGDVDMKMRVNVDGLAVKFGNTEKVMLADILEVEGNMKTDKEQLYYLEESGSTSINFNVAKVSSEVDVNRMNVSTDFGSEVIEEIKRRFNLPVIPDGFTVPPYIPDEYIPFDDSREFHLSLNFGDDVKKLTSIDLDSKSFSLELMLNDDASTYLSIYEIKDIKVKLPNYIVAEGLDANNEYLLNDKTFGTTGTRSISLGQIKLNGLKFPQGITNTTIPAENYGISGKLRMGVKTAFVMNGKPKATISLVVKASDNNATVSAKSVTGVFDPKINPAVNPVNVKQNLPDFLQDGETRFNITNPTLRFDADLIEIPSAILVKNAQLTSVFTGSPEKTVTLASEGITLKKQATNTVYFYQGDKPYDPNLTTSATLSKSANLSNLIETLPDAIRVKLDGGAVSLAQDPVTITMGKNFKAAVNYKFIVPFVFNAGLKINYSEESQAIDLDLDDLQNENLSLTLNANVFSTIPLGLDLTVLPIDAKGKTISGISVSKVAIAPGTEKGVITPIQIQMTGNNKDLFQQLDRIKFTLQAKSGEQIQNAALRSTQYLQITDARIKLNGSIIGDFN